MAERGANMGASAKKDALTAVLMLLVVIPFAMTTGDIFVDPFDPGFGARDFPIGVIGMIILLAGFMLVRSILEIHHQNGWFSFSDEIAETVRFALPLAAIGVFYIWFVDLFQYALPTLLASSAVLALFGNRGVKRLIVVPVVATLIYYGLFFGVLSLQESPGTLLHYDTHRLFGALARLFGAS